VLPRGSGVAPAEARPSLHTPETEACYRTRKAGSAAGKPAHGLKSDAAVSAVPKDKERNEIATRRRARSGRLVSVPLRSQKSLMQLYSGGVTPTSGAISAATSHGNEVSGAPVAPGGTSAARAARGRSPGRQAFARYRFVGPNQRPVHLTLWWRAARELSAQHSIPG
jgi:hypothetical protein